MIDYSKYEKVNIMEFSSGYWSSIASVISDREKTINKCLDKIYTNQCEVIDIKTDLLIGDASTHCAIATIIYGKPKTNKK